VLHVYLHEHGKAAKDLQGRSALCSGTDRKRWGTDSVLVEDHGHALVVRPTPDDPIAAAYGFFASTCGPTASELRDEEREAENDTEQRKSSA